MITKKKIVSKKGLSPKRAFFLLQVIVVMPVLFPVILVNLLSEITLEAWQSYRKWYFGSNRKKRLAKA